MFLIDKITSINEDGVGVVLGRQLIKFGEIKKELGISQDTYSRWINKLVKYPYVEATRTP
jgi:DNA-binding MarR family transcriptional regulator